jgi:hypothetical protein
MRERAGALPGLEHYTRVAALAQLVASTSSVAVSIAVTVSATVAVSTTMLFLPRRIATLLLRGSCFYPSHFLRPGLLLGPLVVPRRVIPAHLLFSPLLRGAAFDSAHLLLWAGLVLSALLVRGPRVIPAHFPLIYPLRGGTVLPARIAFCRAGRAE